jgi:hypothetical protein
MKALLLSRLNGTRIRSKKLSARRAFFVQSDHDIYH